MTMKPAHKRFDRMPQNPTLHGMVLRNVAPDACDSIFIWKNPHQTPIVDSQKKSVLIIQKNEIGRSQKQQHVMGKTKTHVSGQAM